MSTIRRVRGDSYPIQAILKVNGVVVDLTGSTVTMGYVLDIAGSVARTIAGTIIDPLLGSVQFNPTAEDFTVAGNFRYDIQRVTGGVKTTHLTGALILDDDVTKA